MKELHYHEISLKPQRCCVDSRKECDTSVSLGPLVFDMPVYPANMKSVVDVETCKFFARNNWFYTMHRFDVDMIDFILEMNKEKLFTSISVGINQDSYNILNKIYQEPLAVDYMTIDVANAWSSKTEHMVRFIKEKFPETFLIVGNVATSEAVDSIQNWGADAIKVGIAGGCFIAGTSIMTKNGIKNIEDIQEGDEVLTHKNRYKRVLGLSQRIESNKLIEINDEIRCTPNHEFYVLNKKYKDVVTDDNIDEYAEWTEAENLNDDFYLLKIKEG